MEALRAVSLSFLFAFLLTPVTALGEDGSRLISPQDRSTLVSTEIRDTEIQTVLKLLAQLQNSNIAFQRDVSGQVHNLQVSGVPAEQLFQILLRMNNLYSEQVGNIVVVYPIEQYIHDAREREELRRH